MTFRDMLSKLKMLKLQKTGIPFHDGDTAGDTILMLILALTVAFFAVQLSMLGHTPPFPAGRTVFM